MNHYEELGVGRDARTEEIRQAYKTLARLLHPDSQADEKLKAMAERQMQRLNEILGTLTDPQRRRAYDEGLAGPRAGVAAPWEGEARRPGRPLPRSAMGPASPISGPVVSRGAEWVQSAARYWFWVLMGATCVGTAAMWWAMPPERNVPEVLPARPARAQALESETSQDRPKAKRSTPPGSGARAEQHPKEAFIDPAVRNQAAEPGLADPVASVGVQWQAPEAPGKVLEGPAESQASAHPKSGESPFAGNWFYLPRAGEATDFGEYPAVYIEFLLAQEDGELVGSYHAKYQVRDKAIWPEVVLRIRSRAPLGESTRAEWTDRSGAKGVLEMALRSPGLMSVTWWTTEFAARPQLTSGSALLVRQQAP